MHTELQLCQHMQSRHHYKNPKWQSIQAALQQCFVRAGMAAVERQQPGAPEAEAAPAEQHCLRQPAAIAGRRQCNQCRQRQPYHWGPDNSVHMHKSVDRVILSVHFMCLWHVFADVFMAYDAASMPLPMCAPLCWASILHPPGSGTWACRDRKGAAVLSWIPE